MAKKINIIANLIDKQFKKQMQDLQNGKYNVNVNVNGSGMKNANAHMNQLGNSTRNVNTVFGKLKNTISNTFSSGKIAMTSYLLVLNEINKAGKQAKETIKELDKAVTDLSIASNLSRESVSALMKDYNNLAKDMKSTTLDVSKAADDYIRAGKSMSEAQVLIKDSIMLSKLGQIESSVATEDLLATMNGLNLSIEEVGRALDAMVAIDMAAATSSGDIATALKYCASSADVAGVSFNKLAAMIGTVQDKTQQSAETVGTFMNTLLSRYRNVKIGQFVDEDGEDLSEVETILKSLDLKLRDSNQEFRNFEVVLDEVASKWNTYSSVQQAAIAKAFSGTRQQNRFIALMEGYNKTLELTEVAANSAGTAVEKFNKSYANSLEAKKNTLQASFESLIMSSDLDKLYSGILEATNALVQFINKANALKGVFTSLAVTGGIKAFLSIKTGVTEAYIALNQFHQALNLVKQPKISTNDFTRLLMLSKNLSASQTKLILSSKNLTLTQKKQILMNQGLSASEARLRLQNLGLATSYTGLKAATVSVTNACKGLFSTLLANPIFLITTAVSAATMAWQSYKQSIEETRQANMDAATSAKEEVDSLNELYIQYSKLSGITDKTSQQEEDFKQVIQDITEALGSKAEALEGLTAGTDRYTESLEKATKAELESQYATAKVGAKAAEEALNEKAYSSWSGSKVTINKNERMTGIEEHVAALKEVEPILKQFEDISSNGIQWEPINWDKTQDMNALVEYYYALIEAREKLVTSDNADFLMTSDIYEDINTTINDLKDSVEDYAEQQYEALKLNYEWQNGIPTTKEELDAMEQSILNASGAGKEFQEVLKGFLTKDFSSLVTQVDNTGEEVKATEQAITSLFDNLTSSKESIDKFTSSVESAYDSYAKLMNPNVSSSDILSSIQSITSAVSDMEGSLNWEFIDGQANSLDLLGAAIEDVSRKYAESILSGAGIDVDSKFGQMLADNIIQAQKASTELENLNSNIDSLQSAYSDLTDIVESYNETGYLTFDQLQTLLELEPQYLACLVDENGQLQLNEQAMTALANQRLNDAEAQAVQQAITELGQLALQDEKTAVEENGTAFYNAISKLAGYNQELSTTIAEATVGASAIRDLNAAINGAESQGASDGQIQTVLDNLNAKLQAINSVRDKINTDGLGDVVGKKSSSSSAKNTTESIVWIERAIENLESEIEKLDKIANSAYASAGLKNQALADQISKVNEEIQLQQQAYEAYMAKAESVGLSDEYKSLVQNGAITIEDITDEDLKKAIDNYTEWYDKAQDTQDKINDLYEKSKDLHVSAFENGANELEKLRDSQAISEREYLDRMTALWEFFYKNQVSLAEVAKEKKLELLDEEKSYLQSVANAATALLDNQIDDLEDQKDAAVQGYKDQIEVLENLKKPLEEQLEMMEKAREKEEKILALQKAQYELKRAENQRSQLKYVNGQMIYTTDDKAIRDAQDDVSEAEFELAKFKIQEQIDAYDRQIDKLNELIDQTEKYYDDQINGLNKYKDEWQKAIDMEELAINMKNFTDMFGENSIGKLLSGDTTLIANWKQSYLDTLSEIDTTSTGTIGEITKQFADLAGIDLSNTSAQTQYIASQFNTLGESVGNVTASIGSSSNGEDNKENGNTGKENKEEESSDTLVGAIQTSYDVASEAIPAQVEMMNSYAESIHNVTNEVNELISSIERLNSMSINALSIGGNAYASGTKKAEKGLALVAEEKPEAIVNNDGKVLLAEEPTLVNMEGGETVYNGDETEKMLSAKGIRPLREEDNPILYRISHMNPDEVRAKLGIGSYTPAKSFTFDAEKSIANSNVVNNNSKPSLTVNGGINVTCPGVNSKEVMNQVSTALHKEIGGIYLDALQDANITR